MYLDKITERLSVADFNIFGDKTVKNIFQWQKVLIERLEFIPS